jgi:hypothetical protein
LKKVYEDHEKEKSTAKNKYKHKARIAEVKFNPNEQDSSFSKDSHPFNDEEANARMDTQPRERKK